MQKSINGFTLIEVSIALVIVGLLLMGGMALLSASSDTARYKSTQSTLNEVKQTLQGYYVINKRLPCPDTDGDGIENPPTPTGTCTNARGFLPHVTLGVGGNGDAWGERFKYVVSRDSSHFFTTATTDCSYARPNSASADTVRIQDLNTAATSYIADFAAFAIVSTGKNGRQTNAGMTGAFTNDGGCTGLNVREQENCDADSTLRFGNPMADGSSITFDDMGIWVGDYQLISQLRKAGGCDAASGGTGGGSAADPTSRTPADLSANPGQTVSGNYTNGSSAISTSSGNDKVVITGNMNRDLNLLDGDNTLDVQGNANSTVTAGAGKDTVRVQGNLTQPVNLGDGDDYLEVWGNSNATINMGAANDSVRIEGNATSNVSLGSGSNSIYIGGNVTADITAVGGTATVYLNSYTTLSSVPSAIKGDSSLTLMCKSGASFVVCS